MVNLWLVLRDDAKQAINTALSAGEDYSGPVPDKAIRIFRKMVDRRVVQNMFNTPTIGGNVYHMYSLYFKGSEVSAAADAIEYLTTEYPDHIIVGGAWKWDGSIIPGYEPHAQLIKMMPDIVEYDNDGEIVGTTPATELTDVHLVLGQSPREFT